MAVWLLDVVVWRFSRTRGAGLSGDEPHYFILARMLAHGSVHPLRFYRQDLVARSIYPWPSDLLASAANLHAYRGPHGLVSIHGLGLPLLMAPFVAVAGRSGGIAGLMAIEAVGFVFLFARVTAMVRLGRSARVLSAVAMAGPAVWLASTQVYPDFIAGLLVAIAVAEVARFEVIGRLDVAGVAAMAFSLGLLPWLHIKNVAPAGIVLAALAVVAWRHRPMRRAVIAACPALLSWLLLLAYDMWGFGRPLGVPQPGPTPSWAAFTQGLGLLLDRHQGLFVQVPTVLVAVIGIWMARRAAPFAAAATAISVIVLLYLNASYVGVPYGGTALAGRFSWSAMAPLLSWIPFAAARFRTTARTWGMSAAIGLIWVIQAIPILAGRHVYYNAQISGAPWDPSLYPGWWGPVNRVLPELVPKGPLWGIPSYGVAMSVLIAVGIGVAVVAVTGLWASRHQAAGDAAADAAGAGDDEAIASSRDARSGRGTVPATFAAAAFPVAVAVAVAALAAVVRAPLPAKPLVFPGPDVGSPLVAGQQPVDGATVPLAGVGAGDFALTLDYRLSGRATVSSYCTTGTPARPGPPTSPASATLGAGTVTVTLELRCPTGIIWFRSAAQPGTRLDVATVAIRKTGD